jgi:hypothetical protein
MEKGIYTAEEKKINVVFQVHAGNNPFTGYSIYRDILNSEIYEYCGQYYEDCDQETKQHLMEIFSI